MSVIFDYAQQNTKALELGFGKEIFTLGDIDPGTLSFTGVTLKYSSLHGFQKGQNDHRARANILGQIVDDQGSKTRCIKK
jgi:hypothetical protein